MIRKYTGHYCESLLPAGIKINLLKSRINSLKEHIKYSQKIFLTCERHGDISRPFKTYDLARYGREYKSLTPCNECDPTNYNHITINSVKEYIESEDRFITHGSRFRLMTTEESILKFFNTHLTKDWRNVPLDIENLYSTTTDNKKIIIKTTYDKFRKNSGLNISPSKRESWLANLIGFLASHYGTLFTSEKSFEGLVGLKGGKLSYDYYFPKLDLLVEIDGTQHVQETPEFHENPSDKLKEIQHHDKLKNDYARNNGFKLVRLKAYKVSKNRLQHLTPKESYEQAMNFMSDIFLKLYQKQPPKISEYLTKQYFSSNGAVLNRCAEKIQKTYNGDFTLIERLVPYKSNHATALILKCKRDHYLRISEAKVGKEKDYQSAKKNLCFKCEILDILLKYQKSCLKNGFRIMNIGEILIMVSSTYENPIDHFKKPKVSEIKLLIGCAKKEYISFYTPLEGFCIQKLNWHLDRKQSWTQNASKVGTTERSIKNKAFFLLTNYDLTKIENQSEYLLGKKKAKEHNDNLRIGNKPTAPKLPKLILHHNIDYRNKSFKNITTLLKRRSDFQLVTNKNNFIDNQSYIGLKHNSCGCVSFHRAFKVKQFIDNKEPLVCQFRPCYEKYSGKTLATTRNKRTTAPSNKNQKIYDEVKAQSNSILIPEEIPDNVRSSFKVKIDCIGAKLHGRILTISSHDNYIRRNGYEKISRLIESNQDLDGRIELINSP